ncbi:MAG: hypothetical protein LF885_05960 [Rickettsia endosymbiont of Culicoides impunctatus]|nr:MAG: hypothetical protein LF885_05960 [Rickettsia endosymbiont of Culicoides impunctatus]
MLHISQVFYKKEQSDAIKEGRPIKDFGEFAQHLNQHIYNDSIFAGKVHDNIVKILLKTQLVVEQKYAIISGGDKIEQAKGVAAKEQQVAKTRDHTEFPAHPEHSEEPNQTKDELDVKLQKIIQDNPEINQKIEEHGGYDNLKQRLVEIAKELFGISEAQACPAPMIAAGIATGGEGAVATGTAFGGIAAVNAITDIPKNALVAWLFKNIGDGSSGQILKIALTLAVKPESVMNIMNPQQQNDFEKRKHDDNSNKPSTSKQQQKVSATSFMPSDPNDNDPDDEFSHFKKKDGSNRYECEKQESPEWKSSQNFKDEFRTNGGTGKNKEYYRWDMKHKDIEIYDHKARYIGSKDTVTGKIYRQGDMRIHPKLEHLI